MNQFKIFAKDIIRVTTTQDDKKLTQFSGHGYNSVKQVNNAVVRSIPFEGNRTIAIELNNVSRGLIKNYKLRVR